MERRTNKGSPDSSEFDAEEAEGAGHIAEAAVHRR